MTDKDLHALNRRELLELLVRQEKENARLKNALAMANKEAEMRQISIEQAGSIAEASLQLTNVFEEAEKAAQIYLENVRRCCSDQNAVYDRIVGQAKAEADRILAEAESEKRRILKEADDYWQNVSGKMEAFYQAHVGLRDILSVSTRSFHEDAYAQEKDPEPESSPDVRSTFTAVRNVSQESRPGDGGFHYSGKHAESGRNVSENDDFSFFVPFRKSPNRVKPSLEYYNRYDDDYFYETFAPRSKGYSASDNRTLY